MEALMLILITIFIIRFARDYLANLNQMKSMPVLAFKSFVSCYNASPDRWTLHETTVECNTEKRTYSLFNTTVKEVQVEIFCFSYIDLARYRLWCNKLSKHKQTQINDKKIARMMAAVKEGESNYDRFKRNGL